MEKSLTIFCKKILLRQIFTGLFSFFSKFFFLKSPSEKIRFKIFFPQQLAQHESENFRFFDRVRVFFQKAMKLEMGFTPGSKGVVDRAGKHRPNFLLVKQARARISHAKPSSSSPALYSFPSRACSRQIPNITLISPIIQRQTTLSPCKNIHPHFTKVELGKKNFCLHPTI